LAIQGFLHDIAATEGTELILPAEQPYLNAPLMENMATRHYCTEHIPFFELLFAERVAVLAVVPLLFFGKYTGAVRVYHLRRILMAVLCD
jgi:uncharacterized membrane protein